MVSVFFSYAHEDEELRDQLEKHLAALKRQGVIDTWHDRRITAGDDFKAEISEYLEQSEIILLLVSSSFIASDYCYEIEMSRALERHREGTARVIPVILRHCDWQDLQFGKLKATPTDGKPVMAFRSLDEAFTIVVKDIKQAINEIAPSEVSETTVISNAVPERIQQEESVRSSNLRVKKVFSDYEKEHFGLESFDFITKFFEGSLTELRHRNPELDVSFSQPDATHFQAAIYRNGEKISSCRIWTSIEFGICSIAYSSKDHGPDTSYNEKLTITDDGYSQLLRPGGMLGLLSPSQGDLTMQGAAEYLWTALMRPLQQ